MPQSTLVVKVVVDAFAVIVDRSSRWFAHLSQGDLSNAFLSNGLFAEARIDVFDELSLINELSLRAQRDQAQATNKASQAEPRPPQQ